MKRAAALPTLVLLGATLLAACDPSTPKAPPPPKSAAPPQAASTPATKDERKESAPPVQGQVDPKETPQQKDFEPKK